MKKFIGDRKFYRMVLSVAVPIMIQNAITNFVSLLDNIMVGRIGTEQMSGVSIVNQLIFVFNLCIFGAFSGAGIFTAQYYGSNDDDGIRQTCRFKLEVGVLITLAASLIFIFAGNNLIGLYLNEGSEGDLVKTLEYACSYLSISLVGLPFFMIVQAYASTLRECGETVVPMRAGVVAVFVNLFFNWILIYGNLGFPCLGVRGAAIATVLSRVVEAAIVIVWAQSNKAKFPFLNGLLSSLKINPSIAKKIIIIGSPLLLNETIWSAGMATLNQCYSMRGLDSVAGFNISTTMVNVFKTVFLAMGATVGIIVGRYIGAGKMEEAVDSNRKMTACSVGISVFVSLVMVSFSKLFPMLYNTTDNAKLIATHAIMVAAFFMPFDAYKNATYYTLRSGGRTWVTFLFDGFFLWTVNVPIAYCLSRFTNLSSVTVYFIVCSADLIKATIGTILVKKRIWLRNLT